jgi:ABC-type Zn uptake system ZnuABC Zn-binding protein ZnuA
MLPSPPMLCARWLLVLCTLLLGEAQAAPSAPTPELLNVVVTIPVLKDLVEQVGKPHVRVTSLLNGYENEHTYSPKPSDLVAIRKARLLFEVGIGLEVWVASLVKNAGSPSLQVVTTSKGIALIRDHQDHDGAQKEGTDNEPVGNPHVWLDPESAATMMRHITQSLIAADPAHATDYRNNQAAYLARLDNLRTALTERIARLADRRFVAHHAAWPYFARRFGLQIVGTIHAQSGAEPSARQLQHLVTMIKKERVKVIVSEIQLNQRIPELLAKESGARVIVLTTLPGGLPGTETYLDMLRYNVLQLANALEPA